jgi:uncharacterized membrane protein YbhN (UPF0104 family)
MLLLVAMVVSLLVAVPALSGVTSEITHIGAGWLVLAGALELASCASFVVLFRHFFARVPTPAVRRLAWTEMGSGALLPGGGVGSLAVGGWLLHLAGMPTREIVRNSSGLFFLTSAVNVATLVGGGCLLASGVSAGNGGIVLAGVPIALGVGAVVAALTLARLSDRGGDATASSRWLVHLISGIADAKRALAHPSWRLVGAFGYLGFDIAVLWATLSAVGYEPPIAVLILGYIIGYLANLIPVPGGVGVLEGGLAGTLVLYGAPVTQAAAGVLVYHAIAFWIPSLGGLLAYRLLRRDLGSSDTSSAPRGALLSSTDEPPTPIDELPESSSDDQREEPQPPPSRRSRARVPASRLTAETSGLFPAFTAGASAGGAGRGVAASAGRNRRR